MKFDKDFWATIIQSVIMHAHVDSIVLIVEVYNTQNRVDDQKSPF